MHALQAMPQLVQQRAALAQQQREGEAQCETEMAEALHEGCNAVQSGKPPAQKPVVYEQPVQVSPSSREGEADREAQGAGKRRQTRREKSAV